MAPINTMSVLAFATAALAVPYHGHGHSKFHNNKPSGFSAYPYPSANGTGIYASGTGFATGSPVAPASETVVVSDVETTTAAATTYADATSTCTSDVTVTTTVKKTVTITGSASSVEVASSSSSEAAPVESSSEFSAPAYSAAPTTYSTKAEAVTQESPAATSSASSSADESSSTASVTMTYSAANKNVDINIGYGSSSAATSSSAAASSTASSSSGKTGKRGVSYNDASLTGCLTSSSAISWAYNWGSSSSGLSDSVKFIPTLWGTASMFTNSWSENAKSAIESGSTHLFSFNEPDLSEQANMSPSEAATAWKQYMEPFAGQAKLCAPSVTNGGGSMGLTWLSSFLEQCSDCTIDCVNIHWYDSAENVAYFKQHVNDAADIASGKEIFLSEFAATGSDDQISEFLETVMPWMDSNDSVGGYAYFMAADGKLISGTEQSAIGKIYASS
jgi:hypothetical protein